MSTIASSSHMSCRDLLTSSDSVLMLGYHILLSPAVSQASRLRIFAEKRARAINY